MEHREASPFQHVYLMLRMHYELWVYQKVLLVLNEALLVCWQTDYAFKNVSLTKMVLRDQLCLSNEVFFLLILLFQFVMGNALLALLLDVNRSFRLCGDHGLTHFINFLSFHLPFSSPLLLYIIPTYSSSFCIICLFSSVTNNRFRKVLTKEKEELATCF